MCEQMRNFSRDRNYSQKKVEELVGVRIELYWCKVLMLLMPFKYKEFILKQYYL